MDKGESTDFLVRYPGSRRMYRFSGSLPWIKKNVLISSFITMDEGECNDFLVHYHESRRM